MTALKVFCLATLLVFAVASVAQERGPSSVTGQTDEMLTLSASGEEASWLEWPTMTGDWGGLRTDLANRGVTVKLDVTETLQINTRGGRRTTDGARAPGKSELDITFDLEKLGLWKGGYIVTHMDVAWGRGVTPTKTGDFFRTNFGAMGMDDSYIAFGEYFLMQNLLDGQLTLVAGMADPRRAFDTNAYANDERRQFLNGALTNNPLLPPGNPFYNAMMFGAIVRPSECFSVTAAVADAWGTASRSGFSDGFHGDPADEVWVLEPALHTKLFGKLPGNYRFGGWWASADLPRFEGGTADQDWGFYSSFDQLLIQEAESETQGLGAFFRYGYTPKDHKPVVNFYSFGAQYTGLVPTRDMDVLGVGFAFGDFSNDLPVLADETVVESYYNMEITPWLHTGPDLQVIVDPGGDPGMRDAIVVGWRLHAEF